MVTWDAVIAGAGPAGLAAAIALRRRGLTVAIFEGLPSPTPIDKCCGEGLMPDALEALRQLGIVLPPSIGMPIRGIRFLDGETMAQARFPQRPAAGIRRTALHSLLTQHAEQAGAPIFRGKPIRDILPGGVRAGHEIIRCRWIVAADGSQSTLRRAAGLHRIKKDSRRFGSRQHFRIAPWSDLVEIHWAHRAQAYVTPVAEDQVGIAIICSDPLLRFDVLLDLFPALQKRLRGATATSKIRGAMTASRRLASVTSKNIALLGDASGSVDALTGLGLSLAFQQAVALSDALAQTNLPAYATAHRRIARLPRVMETLMLTMTRHDRFRHRAIRALSAEPAHFSSLLGLHAGEVRPGSFALHCPMALWRFFTA